MNSTAPAPYAVPDRRSVTERVMRLFTDVRPGEGRMALLLATNVFLLLCAYYMVKPLREGWIAVSDIGSLANLTKMEVKAYTSFAQGVILVGAMRWYSVLVDRWRRGDLILRVTLFCMGVFVLFWLLRPDFLVAHLPLTGVLFYVWVGMFGVFVVAQFWAFAADLYSDEQGRRLIPMVAIGGTAGAAFGAWMTERLVRNGTISADDLLLVALVPLALTLVLTHRADVEGAGGRAGRPPPPRARKLESERGSGGVRLVFRTRFLLAVAVVTLLLNWVNTNGENLLFRVVQEALEGDARAAGVGGSEALLDYTRTGTTAFYGNFYFWVNVLTLGLQAFVASRALRYGGFATIMLLPPAIALLGYGAMAMVPVLAIVKGMKILDNATDYSIGNTARHVLWLPVPSGTKFKGKPTVDTLFARIGDGLSAATVLVGVQLLGLSTAGFFGFTVSLVLGWLAVAFVVVREHRRFAAEADSEGDEPGGAAGAGASGGSGGRDASVAEG